jgi:general secretion pathway protein F
LTGIAGALVLIWLMAPLMFRHGMLRAIAAKIPILGGVWRWTSLAEFAHLLGLLLENSLPLPEALRLTGEGVQDASINSACKRMAGEVESGKSLGEAMAACRRAFPSGLARLVQWAGNQRSLPEVLHMAGEMYEARARAQGAFAGTTFSVLAVLMILWGILTVVAGLMLPMISLISRLSG